MKKSSFIELVLITATLASCHETKRDWDDNAKVYLRGDSTAPFSRAHTGYAGGGTGGYYGSWYYAFRPYGHYFQGNYQRAGYYSDAIGYNSNVGSNGFKGTVTRGGFGHSGFSVSS
jgi:hypothetical protein